MISGTMAVDESAVWINPDQRRFVICNSLGCFIWVTMVWPCIFVTAELVASRCLRWSGWKGGIFVTIGFVLFVVVPAIIVGEALKALEAAANTSDLALGVLIALIPAGVLVGLAVSAGRCPKRLSRCSRKSPDACLEEVGKPSRQQVNVDEDAGDATAASGSGEGCGETGRAEVIGAAQSGPDDRSELSMIST